MRRLMAGLSLMVLALVLMLAACGGDATGPKTPTVTGAWSGTIGGTGNMGSLSLTLTETNGAVVGSGVISGSESVAVHVTGTHAHPSVSLAMTSSGYEDCNFSGTMTATNTIAGTLNGSGFYNRPVTLTRQ